MKNQNRLIYVAHRGNIYNKQEENENSPEYIQEALSNEFFVEIDVWQRKNKTYLGHDEPQYQINLKDYPWYCNSNIFWHCKDMQTYIWFLENADYFCFFYQDSPGIAAINNSSIMRGQQIYWTYKYPISRGILMIDSQIEAIENNIAGLCSDEIGLIKQQFTSK